MARSGFFGISGRSIAFAGLSSGVLLLSACATGPESQDAASASIPRVVDERDLVQGVRNGDILQMPEYSITSDMVAAFEPFGDKIIRENHVPRMRAAATAFRSGHPETALPEATLENKIANIDPEKEPEKAFRALVEGIAVDGSAGNGGFVRGENGLVHEPSGLHCAYGHAIKFTNRSTKAERTSALALAAIRVFSEAGTDVSCQYVSEDGGSVITVFASYWPDVSLDDHYAEAFKLIQDEFSGGQAAESISFAPGPDGDFGFETVAPGEIDQPHGTMVAAFTGGAETTNGFKTGLWLDKVKGWHVKVRATHAEAAHEVEVLAAMLHAFAMLEVLKDGTQPQLTVDIGATSRRI